MYTFRYKLAVGVNKATVQSKPYIHHTRVLQLNAILVTGIEDDV